MSGSKRYPLGYYHMCRFFSIMLPHHPLLINMFTFYWRLDSDSHLLGPPLVDDLFDYMKEKHLQYAFVMVEVDAPEYVQGLWELFHQFLTRCCLTPSAAVRKTQTSFFGGGYSPSIFYNNLELSNASMWRNEPRIAAWLRQVDESGGIYQHRWGDAPIHTLAVTQFIERDQVIRLRDFGYFHRREYVCAEGFQPCVIPSHLEASANRPFPRGCHPTRNSLCQYYPEKRRTL
jgi:alpha 1,2-mannosyltransferase